MATLTIGDLLDMLRHEWEDLEARHDRLRKAAEGALRRWDMEDAAEETDGMEALRAALERGK